MQARRGRLDVFFVESCGQVVGFGFSVDGLRVQLFRMDALGSRVFRVPFCTQIAKAGLGLQVQVEI